jgi:hypothetical protein
MPNMRKRRRWQGGMMRRPGECGQPQGTRTHHVTITMLTVWERQREKGGKTVRACERERGVGVGRERERERGRDEKVSRGRREGRDRDRGK